MHDVVIRDAKIVDGGGEPAVYGDVAIDGDRLVSVGERAGPGRREINAAGLLATPGWVDIHTHYDGQATWDPILAPSSWNGVTTLLFGNCGVGFAPARAEHRDALIELMDGVEDIPGIALAEGLKWDWTTFPEYLDALARLPRAINVGAQVPHHPLRVYVMGERAIRREMATADDIKRMSQIVEEAIGAGAFGFTTSRTDQHRTSLGAPVPARHASIEELIGIGQALGRAGRGVFGVISDFENEDEEFGWMARLNRETGRSIWFLLTDRTSEPTRWRRILDKIQSFREGGAAITAQVGGRPIGVLLSVAGSMNPFELRTAYQAYQLDKLPVEDRLKRLRDPTVRRAILADKPTAARIAALPPVWRALATNWSGMYPMTDTPDYEPDSTASVAAMALKQGRSPEEVAYDHLAADPEHLLFYPVANYATGDHEPVRQMLSDPNTLLGLSDGGAHCGAISDASVPTYMLSHWARDRRRGPRFSLESIVRKQTKETADFYGLTDRGMLKAGMIADLNLIDFGELRLRSPRIVHDLPAGGRRFVQKADGYVATVVSGVAVFENGEHTGALPGSLLRSGTR